MTWTFRSFCLVVQPDKKKRLRFRMCCGNLGAATSLKSFATVTGVNQDELQCLVTVKNELKSLELPLSPLMSWLWLPVLLFHLHVLRLWKIVLIPGCPYCDLPAEKATLEHCVWLCAMNGKPHSLQPADDLEKRLGWSLPHGNDACMKWLAEVRNKTFAERKD